MEREIADDVLMQMAGETSTRPTSDPRLDATLWVEFEKKQVMDMAKSKEARRPFYTEQVYISIGSPGNRDLVVRPYWDDKFHPNSDSSRFGDRYAKWKAGEAELQSGTPLSVLANVVPPILNASEVKGFEVFHVRTAEALLAMPDSEGQKFMGFHETKRRVQAYLDLLKADAPQTQLRVELEERDTKLAELSRQNAEQAEMLKAMQEQLGKLEKRKFQSPAPAP